MAGGLQTFGIEVERENPKFAPGETLAGHVVVELIKSETIRALIIRFKGSGETLYKGSKTNVLNRHEQYFKHEAYLLTGGDSAEIEIVSGYHEFPFNFALPHDIPSSFTNECGYIKYTVEAILERPRTVDHETSLPFIIETPYYLTEYSNSTDAINSDEHQAFCCFPFCFNMGSLNVNIVIPTTGYVVGDPIEAQINLDNHSTSVHVTHVELRLKQKITISYSDGSTRKQTKFVKYAEKRGPFNKKDKIMMHMQVPDVPPSTCPHTKLFDISYHLSVFVQPSGCHSTVKLRYPIVIGTVPIVTCQPQCNCCCMVPSFPSLDPIASSEILDPTITFVQPDAVDLIPIEATTPTPETPPPSYDDCMKNVIATAKLALTYWPEAIWSEEKEEAERNE